MAPDVTSVSMRCCCGRGLRARLAVMLMLPFVCGGRLRACPRYPVDKIEDRRPVEFSVDPEDRNRQDLLPRCDEYVDHDYVHADDRVVRERLLPLPEDVGYDYFPYGSNIPTSTTPTPDVYDYFVYFRYFPDVDYVGYFLHVPKTPALP